MYSPIFLFIIAAFFITFAQAASSSSLSPSILSSPSPLLSSLLALDVDASKATPILDSSLSYLSLLHLEDSPLSLCFPDESPISFKLAILARHWLNDAITLWLPQSAHELLQEIALFAISFVFQRMFRSKPNNNRNPN